MRVFIKVMFAQSKYVSCSVGVVSQIHLALTTTLGPRCTVCVFVRFKYCFNLYVV